MVAEFQQIDPMLQRQLLQMMQVDQCRTVNLHKTLGQPWQNSLEGVPYYMIAVRGMDTQIIAGRLDHQDAGFIKAQQRMTTVKQQSGRVWALTDFRLLSQ